MNARASEAMSDHHEADVVVVGAGLSGLVAARRLIEEGFEALVVEATDRVGGRVRTEEISPGIPVDLGAGWVCTAQTRVLSLCGELGIETFPTYTRGRRVAISGSTAVPVAEDAGLSLLEQIDYSQVRARFDRLVRSVSATTPWAAKGASRLDSQTLEDWLRRATFTAGAREVLDLAFAVSFGGSLRQVSLLAAVSYAGAAGGFDVLTEEALEKRIVGGSERIAEVLAAGLEDHLLLDSPVRRIVRRPSGAIVETARVSIPARKVIVATDPAASGWIPYDPPLPRDRRELASRWASGSGVKAFALYETPFWRERGLSGTAIGDGEPVALTFDGSPPRGEAGVLGAFLQDPPEDEGERREAVVAGLGAIFGEPARDPLAYADHDWGLAPWVSGCVPSTPPGLLTSCGAALREPVGPIHWAGAETSGIWTGHMEGAVRAGERAAAEVRDWLRDGESAVETTVGAGELYKGVRER